MNKVKESKRQIKMDTVLIYLLIMLNILLFALPTIRYQSWDLTQLYPVNGIDILKNLQVIYQSNWLLEHKLVLLQPLLFGVLGVEIILKNFLPKKWSNSLYFNRGVRHIIIQTVNILVFSMYYSFHQVFIADSSSVRFAFSPAYWLTSIYGVMFIVILIVMVLESSNSLDKNHADSSVY